MRRDRLFLLLAGVLVLGTWATLAWAREVADWLRGRDALRATMWLVFLAVGAAVGAAMARDRPRPAALAALAPFALAYAVALRWVRTPEEAFHFVQYGAIGVLCFAGLATRPGARIAPAAAGAFLLTAGAGWIDEGIQALLPSRYYDLRDVAFNATAGALAIAATLTYRSLRRRAAAAQR